MFLPVPTMRFQRTANQEVACQLRKLYFYRTRLDTAISLLEEVVQLRKRRPPAMEPGIEGKSTRKVAPAA